MKSLFTFASSLYRSFAWHHPSTSLLIVAVFVSNAVASQPGDPWLNRPIQITSRTNAVLDMAVSTDGQTIVYISGDERPTTLWMASADPERLTYPQKLVGGPSIKSSPAISTDGRFIAYVDTDNDVKGDIYLIDRKSANTDPVRLTGREAEDGGPEFSTDARFLYFHRATADGSRHLFYLDLQNPGTRPVFVDTGSDAFSCVVSPDSDKIAFVSNRDDPSGDLFVLDRTDDSVRRITKGPAIDMFPIWHADSRTLYFSRIGIDTNQDGRLDTDDATAVYRIRVDKPVSTAFPVTAFDEIAYKPYTAENRLYFLSDRGGVSNCWSLPETGWIRNAQTPEEQLSVAAALSRRIPYDPYQTLLAFTRVMELYPDNAVIAARAGYRAAAILQALDLSEAAFQAYGRLRVVYPDVLPESVLADIRQTGLEFQTAAASLSTAERKDSLRKSLLRLEQIAQESVGVVSAEARIEAASLLITDDSTFRGSSNALFLIEKVLADPSSRDEQKAHGLYLQATWYEKTGIQGQAIEPLRRILLEKPQERHWVDKAVDKIIDHSLPHSTQTDRDEKIRRLNLLASENRETAPALSMGAMNRIGDLYYLDGQWEQAKSVYQSVIDSFPFLTTQTAAARLSLAEIFFREEAFRKAIHLYEHELSLRDSTDRIYQLARNGYIRKKISAGEFHYRLGEISIASSLFNEVISYDETIVEAHRGHIKCAFAAGTLEAVLARYEEKRKQDPLNPVWLYCTGLCLTYRSDGASLAEAKNIIEKAIRLNGSIEYFHQTLGYVHEIRETVYGEKDQLELALLSYQKAYFLNDPEKNPDNRANLELNLGNIYYLLGQYGKAFDFYTDRRRSPLAFSDTGTEIVFYKRLGECAYQNDDLEAAAASFGTAINRIDGLMDPLAPLQAYDQLNRYLTEKIFTPALQIESLREEAKSLYEKQSLQNLKAGELASNAVAPPSAQWPGYKQGVRKLLQDQTEVNKGSVFLAKAYNKSIQDTPGGRPIVDAGSKLADFSRKIQETIEGPERVIELKAEILDRLALVYQVNEQWDIAAETFEKTYAINRDMGNFKNLARNRRSVAYNIYRLAGKVSGKPRDRLLRKASDAFGQVIFLLDRYGLPEPKEKDENGLLDISFATSFDTAAATQAAWGFTEEQERRLAETFISRIALALGDLKRSREELEKQLASYPSPDAVAEKDVYGVSLLYHRAGLLAHATGDLNKAFDCFVFSTRLCLRLENAVSAATNMSNLISVAQKLRSAPDETLTSAQRLDLLVSLDKQITTLLSETSATAGAEPLMRIHNQLGVFYFQNAVMENEDTLSTEQAFRKLGLQQKAVGHLTRGISLYENSTAKRRRKEVETAARLYLNLSRTALALGDDDVAQRYLQKALNASEMGVFPDLQWRALAGLRDYDPALAVLETVPLGRAGCEAMEILDAFAPLVANKLSRGEVEPGLNLLEKLSELERFHRTAFFVKPSQGREKAYFYGLYARLATIAEFEAEKRDADDDRLPFVERRLESEKALLAKVLGPEGENLPEVYRSIKDRRIRETAVKLAALSQKIEEAAEELATLRIDLKEQPQKNDNTRELAARSLATYDSLVRRYRKMARQSINARPTNAPPDFISLLCPESFDTMDLFSLFSDDEAVARIFRLGHLGPFSAFLLTKDEIRTVSSDTPAGLKRKIDEAFDGTVPTIAFEDPLSLEFGSGYPYALSLNHLKQSLNNRKPFKENLGILPQTPVLEMPAESFSLLFNGTGVQETTGADPLPASLLQVNTLWIENGPSTSTTLPTTPGDPATSRLGVFLDVGEMVRLESLLAATSSLSLIVAGKGEPDAVYKSGHLYSIYGCPSVLFLRDRKNSALWTARFLELYARLSAFDALMEIEKTRNTALENDQPGNKEERSGPKNLLFGFRGMSNRQAAKHAKKNFVRYVKSGRAAFDRQQYAAALVFFQDAISVANEISQFDRYLSDLMTYAVESAYRSGRLEDALDYATQLADRMSATAAGTPKEARSLLQLGLLHSKQESYEKAVVYMENAIAIMSAMEPDEDLVQAFMDLGIVLENATRHETSLSRFKAAAQLSRTLDLPELLGEQYLHIGRIYDLRMNQYATSLTYYEKALEQFSAQEDIEKMAESMLNIGRCYRLLGDFAKAGAFYEQSESLLKEDHTPQKLLKAKILLEQANSAWFQGRYEAAFRYQRQCQAVATESGLSSLQVMARNTEGLIWWTLGDYEKAVEVLKNALSLAKQQTHRQDEIASTLNNLGLVLRDKGAVDAALSAFDQAIDIDTAIDSKWGLAYDYRNKGLAYMKLDRFSEAADLFDQAYAISSGIGNRINAAKSILAKGDALFAQNRFKESETAFSTALELSESMNIRETLWRALFGMANVQIVHYKDIEAAETYLRNSIKVIEALRSDIKVKELKENFITDKLDVYETLVELLADRQKPVQAFEIAERSRARNFIDLLGGGQLDLSGHENHSLVNKIDILRSEIEILEHQSATAEDEERPAYESSLKTLRHELENSLVELQLHNPQLASMVTVPPVDTDTLLGLMEPGTALLSYYLLDDEILCWILKATGTPEARILLQRIPVNKDFMEKRLLQYRRIIQNTEPFEKHASELYATLFAPVEKHLDGVHTVGISPHGSLHYLSFATLFDGNSFLVDRISFFYVPSAAVLEYTLGRRTQRPYRSPRVLAVGNPDLGDPVLDLPFAELEVGAIKWNFPEMTILTGRQATENRVVNEISDFDIIHIASHGEFDPDVPLLSAVKLAFPEDPTSATRKSDGNLEAGEIYGLQMNADMVFLSACQTGLGKITAGDDIVGLNRSFFFAGTHTVVSSLWRVSDVSTAILIKNFYRSYMNRNKADCLKNAAIHVKSRYPHPGYWGAFTLVGDYY